MRIGDWSFAWDEAKSAKNLKAHGVSFEEAASVFVDPDSLSFYDPDHSKDEDRYLLFGVSSRLRVLVVCHCYRQDDSVIRIISARRADPPERKAYNARRKGA